MFRFFSLPFTSKPQAAGKDKPIVEMPDPVQHKKPATPTIDKLTERVNEYLGAHFLFADYFMPLREGLLDIAWGFPASEGRHNVGETGLINHSLSVTSRMLENVTAIFTSDRKPEGVQYKFWIEKVKIHACLAGLSHDLGKVMEWELFTEGFDYSPLTDSMRMPHKKFQVRLVKKMPNIGHKDTPVFSVMLLHRMVSACPNFLSSQYFDVKELEAVAEAIYSHHGECKDNLYWQLLVAADREDAKEERDQFHRYVTEEAAVQDAGEARDTDFQLVAKAEKSLQVLVKHLTYSRGYWITENGWLLLLSPKHVVAKKGVAVEETLLGLLKESLGRDIDELTLYTHLHKAGLQIKLTDDENFIYNLHFTGTHGKTVDSLSFVVFDAKKLLSEDEIRARTKFRITNLAGFGKKEEEGVVAQDAGNEEKVQDLPAQGEEILSTDDVAVDGDDPDCPNDDGEGEIEEASTGSSILDDEIMAAPADVNADFVDPFAAPADLSPANLDDGDDDVLVVTEDAGEEVIEEGVEEVAEVAAAEPLVSVLEPKAPVTPAKNLLAISDAFWTECVEKKVEGYNKEVVRRLLDMLAEGTAPSVVQGYPADPDADYTPDQLHVLSGVSLLEHSVNVARHALVGVTNKWKYRDIIITALAHDLGKSAAGEAKMEAIKSHPQAGALLLEEILAENEQNAKYPWPAQVVKAVAAHHVAATSALNSTIEKAHKEARRAELEG